jgi:hypothetical protein
VGAPRRALRAGLVFVAAAAIGASLFGLRAALSETRTPSAASGVDAAPSSSLSNVLSTKGDAEAEAVAAPLAPALDAEPEPAPMMEAPTASAASAKAAHAHAARRAPRVAPHASGQAHRGEPIAPPNDCDPPFTIDESGIKRFKRWCPQ